MARLSRSTLRTVRFYEEAGLLTPVQRTDGGHRLFESTELKKLLLVSDLRAAGFALDEIRAMLETKQRYTSGGQAANDLLARLDEQISCMSERIGILTRLRNDLEEARDLIQHCDHCDDQKHFPNSCGECKVMTSKPAVPDAVAVLWRVSR